MDRLVVLAIAVTACAHGVTRPNPPEPVEQRQVAYSGRVVLQTAALRDEVDGFADVWTRRLAILGVDSKVTYDDDRAHFDLYGVDDLERVARILADHGSAYLDGRVRDGALVTWLAPDDRCDCSARVRVAFYRGMLCTMGGGDYTLITKDMTVSMRGTLYWMIAKDNVYVTEPPGHDRCPNEAYWPDNIVFDVPRTATRDEVLSIVLALAGGTLPAVPQIAAIQRGTP